MNSLSIFFLTLFTLLLTHAFSQGVTYYNDTQKRSLTHFTQNWRALPSRSMEE